MNLAARTGPWDEETVSATSTEFQRNWPLNRFLGVPGILDFEESTRQAEEFWMRREARRKRQSLPRETQDTTTLPVELRQIGGETAASPFAELNSEVEHWISRVERDTSIRFHKEIADRLRELCLSDPDESEPCFVSSRSVRRFLEFLQKFSRTSMPAIGINDNGHVGVEWKESWNKKLVIEFLEDGRAVYCMFTPGALGFPPVERSSGFTTPSLVLERLAGLRAEEWVNGL
jgi:hypothetical protein